MGPDAAGRARALSSAEATFTVALLALLPRLFVAVAWAREPVWDGHYYDFGAQRIAEGLGYSADRATETGVSWQPWCHYPVGYSGFLAMVYRFFGHGPHAGPIANAVIGAATAAVIHRLALRVTSPTRALLAGVVVALSPVLIAYTPLLMTEPLAALGVVLAPATWLALRSRGRLASAVAAGAVLGLTTLVRPQSLLCAPALALFAWAELRDAPRRDRWMQSAIVGAVALAACLAVVAPWTVRNCRVMDGCALVSTNGGWNLAIGASPHATGRFDALRPSDGCREVTGQVQQDRCWRAAGLAWIREDPARWASLIPAKLGHTFDHQSFAVGYLGEADPTAWPEARRAWWRTLLAVSGRALLAFAALGLIALPRRPLRDHPLRIAALVVVLALAGAASVPEGIGAWPLALAVAGLALWQRRLGAGVLGPGGEGLVLYLGVLVAGTCATHAVFFGEDRYQIVIVPALCLFAARGLTRAPA